MIHDLIQGFDPDLFRRFLRTKFPSFAETSRSLSDLASATARSADKPAPWAEARQLGIVKTLPGPNGLNQPLLVAAARLPDGEPLRERSSRLRQFEFARRALDQAMDAPGIDGVITQGLFVFYDDAGNFRLSLVHGKAQGARLVYRLYDLTSEEIAIVEGTEGRTALAAGDQSGTRSQTTRPSPSQKQPAKPTVKKRPRKPTLPPSREGWS